MAVFVQRIGIERLHVAGVSISRARRRTALRLMPDPGASLTRFTVSPGAWRSR